MNAFVLQWLSRGVIAAVVCCSLGLSYRLQELPVTAAHMALSSTAKAAPVGSAASTPAADYGAAPVMLR